jgi:hypothetical protein
MATNQEKLDALFNGQQAQVSYDGNTNPYTKVIQGMRTDVHNLAVAQPGVAAALKSIDGKLDQIITLLTPAPSAPVPAAPTK